MLSSPPSSQVLLEYANSTASLSFYMVHGGTNFGFWAGANVDGTRYLPHITRCESSGCGGGCGSGCRAGACRCTPAGLPGGYQLPSRHLLPRLLSTAPTLCSYDYDSPISEAGDYCQPGIGGACKYHVRSGACLPACLVRCFSTPPCCPLLRLVASCGHTWPCMALFRPAHHAPVTSMLMQALRDLIAQHTGRTLPPVPPRPAIQKYGRVELRDSLPLLDAVEQLYGTDGGVRTELPDIMEEYGQRYVHRRAATCLDFLGVVALEALEHAASLCAASNIHARLLAPPTAALAAAAGA